MFKKYLTLIVTILLINLSLSATAFAETKEEKEAKFAEKVKINITKLGTGKEAKVQVKLQDGTKLKGFISKISENSFAVSNETTGLETEVPYPNANQVKGKNFSTGDKIWIAVGITAVVLIVVLSVAFQPERCPCQ